MTKAVTIHELFNEIPAESIQFQMINNAILSADRGSSKKAASIKVGVPEEVAANFMTFGKREKVALLIMIDAETFERARDKVLG